MAVYNYDLVVLGSGPAGEGAAINSVKAGRKVAVVGNIRLVQALELLLVLGPRELAAIDDDAAQAVAVAAQILGQRMHDDVRTVFKRAAQVR